MADKQCLMCAKPLVNRNATARFCSATCRTRGHRHPEKLLAAPLRFVPDIVPVVVGPYTGGRITTALHAELERLGVLDRVDADHALAMALALDLETDSRALASLSREFRAAVADLRASTAPQTRTTLSAIRGTLT